jgi:hypothetical protein
MLKTTDGMFTPYVVLKDLIHLKDAEDNFLYLTIAETESF